MMNTCRFCGEWRDEKSQIIKYGTRHYAHLSCLAARGRAEEILRRMPRWELGTLRYFELQDLGLLAMVRELAKEDQ